MVTALCRLMKMPDSSDNRTVEKLLRQQAALAAFGSFAFQETDLLKILTEAARTCAVSLEVPFSKVCRYRADKDDLLIEAGWGWKLGVVGRVVSQADESSPQGRAYVTGKPIIIRNINTADNRALPAFYEEHSVVSTVDVLIPAIDGVPYGVLEIASTHQHQYDEHDINFLTAFAKVLAEAVATVGRIKALRDALDAKNLLAEELQHRVRNNLQMVSALLESYAKTAPTGEARRSMDLIVCRVTTLAQVYDSLLGVGLSESIDLADYLRALCVRLPALQTQAGPAGADRLQRSVHPAWPGRGDGAGHGSRGTGDEQLRPRLPGPERDHHRHPGAPGRRAGGDHDPG